jgi:hypothetical protein
VTDHDAEAVEDAVAERVAVGVDEVLPATAGPENRPVLVLERDEGVLDPERFPIPSMLVVCVWYPQ